MKLFDRKPAQAATRIKKLKEIVRSKNKFQAYKYCRFHVKRNVINKIKID